MVTYSPTKEKSLPRCMRCPEKLQTIFNFLDTVNQDLDIEKTFHVEEWADVFILACRSDQRVPGLGTALVKEGVRLMEERGLSVFDIVN